MLNILLSLDSPPESIGTTLKGHKVENFTDTGSIPVLISKKNYDLVLMEGSSDLLRAIKVVDPGIEVVLFGDSQEDAVHTVKEGAYAYLPIPVEPDQLRDTINNVQDAIYTRRQTAELELELDKKYKFYDAVGKNPQMLDIFNYVKRIAPYFKTVLITGETGTGKEVVARAVHHASHASESPFIACNCSSLVESLIESDLFGHKKGAFTGADRNKTGLFEAAADGTIFLDEIGDLPLSFQPHLLRVLQDGEFRPVGSHRTEKAGCRVIAATNRDLKYEVKKGRFREDLIYRLTPLIINVPPLRDRKDDIPLLSRAFIDKFNRRTGKGIRGISRPAQNTLMLHNWPGNLRELENVIEQMCILSAGSFLHPADLPDYLVKVRREHEYSPELLDEVIKTHIESVLRYFKGNKTISARALGISRRSLFRKINKYLIC